MDPEELDYEGEWATPNTWGYQLTANYNLGECTPIMCNPQEGELIFKGGGKFYQICQMGGDLFEITSPKTLDEIIAVVKGERRRKIKQNEETRLKSSHSPLLLSVDGWIAPTAKYTFKTQNLTLFGHGMGPAAPVAFTRVLLKLTPGSMCLKAKVEQMRIFMASRYSGKASEEPITKLISAGRPGKGWQTLTSISKSLYACTAAQLPTSSL